MSILIAALQHLMGVSMQSLNTFLKGLCLHLNTCKLACVATKCMIVALKRPQNLRHYIWSNLDVSILHRMLPYLPPVSIPLKSAATQTADTYSCPFNKSIPDLIHSYHSPCFTFGSMTTNRGKICFYVNMFA